MGIGKLAIAETPITILDFETTGLTPGADRVIEISVARKEPGQPAKIVFDTLINPNRRVSATEIHGITDDDVRDAPVFEAIAGDLLKSLSGTVMCAYNVYFDARFLEFELSNVGCSASPPYFCLMYMRPMLGLGARCSLESACEAHDISFENAHIGSVDVEASAKLLDLYLSELERQGVRTFGDLKKLKKYKFFQTFSNDPIRSEISSQFSSSSRLKSRSPVLTSSGKQPPILPKKKTTANIGLREYWDSLKVVLSDLVISDQELNHMLRIKQQYELPDERVRVLHAKAFVSVLSQYAEDKWLDDRECEALARLHVCLRQLGWAPGA